MLPISKNEIVTAHRCIGSKIHRTPILTSKYLDGLTNGQLFFKCENFQKTGSFKIRGATNAIMNLGKGALAKGVATHSSGNHAQALAFAALNMQTKATVVMPSSSSAIKKAAVREYGADIIECEPNQASRESTLETFIEKTGATSIHPFNNYDVMTGQATCAKEILEEMSDLDYIVAPVGGGGLLSGTIMSAQYFSTSTKVVAAEPKGAGDAYQSWMHGEIVPIDHPNTIADGLLTTVGDKTFPVIREFVDEILTVSDEEIIQSMKIIWERMKIIIEPSSAVTLAAVLANPIKFSNKKVALILSGGNVDLKKLPF